MEQFNYILSMQSQWQKEYALQVRATKNLKRDLHNARQYYLNSPEYLLHKNRSVVVPSLQS